MEEWWWRLRDNDRKIAMSGEPWCISNWMSFMWPFLLALCSLRPLFHDLVVITWRGAGCHYIMRFRYTVKRVQLLEIMSQMSSIWATGCMLSDLTWLPLLGAERKSWYVVSIICIYNIYTYIEWSTHRSFQLGTEKLYYVIWFIQI